MTAIVMPGLERPVLDLSGETLRAALQAAVAGSEDLGGIERYVEAVKLKSVMFQQALGKDSLENLELDTFRGLCAFMSPVRRRVGEWLEAESFEHMRAALVQLVLSGSGIDRRVAAFCQRFPGDRAHRWVRDLACETLHNLDPERVPLMNRWVWDAKSNTGVLREVWHGKSVDGETLPVGDGYATFLMLREELSQFLSDNGIFRDVLFYVDVLCAQVYARYICEQGGSYLRTDFSAPEDPMQHTRRMLGLDTVRAGSAKTRLKTIDGETFVLEEAMLFPGEDH